MLIPQGLVSPHFELALHVQTGSGSSSIRNLQAGRRAAVCWPPPVPPKRLSMSELRLVKSGYTNHCTSSSASRCIPELSLLTCIFFLFLFQKKKNSIIISTVGSGCSNDLTSHSFFWRDVRARWLPLMGTPSHMAHQQVAH